MKHVFRTVELFQHSRVKNVYGNKSTLLFPNLFNITLTFRNTEEFVRPGIPRAHLISSLSFIPVEPPLDMHCLSFSPQRRQYVLYEYVKGSPRNFWKSHPSQAPMSVHKNYTVDGSEAISLRRLNETLQLHR